MDELDFLAFAALFKDAYAKCFGHALKSPVTETESKIFSNKVLDQTGLSIGWKSVKNYSLFIIGTDLGKQENPSVATLDTLARYVLGAPYTSEIKRKDDENHYPYWFLYREKFIARPQNTGKGRLRVGAVVLLAGIIVVIFSVIYIKLISAPAHVQFTDNFIRTDDGSLAGNGWFVKSEDTTFWNKRGLIPGQLTLFTLRGDNWPDPATPPIIKNLLLRAAPPDCFTAEIHFKDFIPEQEWQQAGLLLLEDTILSGKSIRLSLAYNDYFGGMQRPKEILIQAITALGNGFGKPEEIAHKVLFYPDSVADRKVLTENFRNSALRIEKHGNKYRFLYAGGTSENSAFKEVVTQEFDMRPKYIGLFAIKGFTNSATIPVNVKFFRISADPCN